MARTPLDSPIKEINLAGYTITEPNTLCRFEKIEFSESVFDLFPSGCLVVRDVGDVITAVKNLSASNPINKYFTIKYDSGDTEYFYINGVEHLNNAASETEENFIGINFTNKLFFLNQSLSVTNLLSSAGFPQAFNIEDFYKDMVTKIKNVAGIGASIDQPKLEYLGSRKFSNIIAYRPINPLKEKVDEATENPIQYMNYISSLACDSTTGKPRFLFWTGFNNDINLKYFSENASGESVYDSYAVYQQDVPIVNGKKKIYVLTTVPASQYLNRNYYYTRKTPKLLNKTPTSGAPTDERTLVTHQFLDDGSKYDIELITESGIQNALSGTIGLSSLDYTNHYGYYQQNDTFSPFANSTLLGMEYGVNTLYTGKNIFGVSDPYPFVDNPEMWKNMWDMTPVHPNIGTSTSGTITASTTNLQKVFEIRNITKPDTSKLAQIRDIELQNFVYYVLCCLREPDIEEEETFFACIKGWVQDPEATATGENGEPLIYRYSWKRLGVNLPTAINNFNNFTYPEKSPWQEMEEGSSPNDYNTWAINLNERKNSSGQPGYYGPGWYTQNLTDPVFIDSVTYRPIGNKGGDLEDSVSGTTCRHIVLMKKIPYIQIVLKAKNYDTAVGVDRDLLLQYIKETKGKYLYCFELANITDGKCNPVE